MDPSSQGATDTGADEAFEAPPQSLEGLAKAVSQGRTVMVHESPLLDGRARAAGFLDIRGWAYSATGLDGVFVYLDGLRYEARLSVPRPDLEGLDGFGVDLTRTGFDLTIELDADQAGQLTVTVVARGGNGHAVGVRGTVECCPEPELILATRGRHDGADPPGETLEASALGAVQRFVPAGPERSLLEAEHDARYGWASNLVRDREVLDAGCGVGQGTAVLAAAGATRAVGVDVSDDAVRSARERFGGAAEFVVGDLTELDFEDGSFDVVACFETIAQVGDPQRALDELRRILRPEGVLLLSVANGAVYPAGDPIHLHEHRPDDIAEALRSRFAEVRLYRQQSHVASLVFDDASFGEPAGEEDLAARVRLARGRHGEAIYTIAVASNTQLPGMDTLVSVGGPFEQRSWHARSLGLLQHAEDGRRNDESSLSWRITRPLRLVQRMLKRARGGVHRRR